MNSQTILFGLVLIATLVIGWFHSSGVLKQATNLASAENNAALSNPLNHSLPPFCAMTLPNGTTPPGEAPSPRTHHDDGLLWAVLDTNGVITSSPRDVSNPTAYWSEKRPGGAEWQVN